MFYIDGTPETPEDSPQEGAVDRVIYFPEVDTTQSIRTEGSPVVTPFPVVGVSRTQWPSVAAGTIFFGLEAVAAVKRRVGGDLGKHVQEIACMGHGRDAALITVLCPILLLVLCSCCEVGVLLFNSYPARAPTPDGDDGVVETFQRCVAVSWRMTFVQQFGRELGRTSIFLVYHEPRCVRHLGRRGYKLRLHNMEAIHSLRWSTMSNRNS